MRDTLKSRGGIMKKFLAIILSIVTLLCLASCSTKETINLHNTFWVEVDNPYEGVVFWDGEPITWSAEPVDGIDPCACVWWEGSHFKLNDAGNRLSIESEWKGSTFGHSQTLNYSNQKLKMAYRYFGIPLISHELIQINVSSLSEYYETMGIKLIRQGSPDYVANTKNPGWF